MTANPSAYDLVQDEQIDSLKEIVTTTYEPSTQVEVSFPVVDRPMNDEEWGALAKSWGSGIVSFGQYPFRLIVDDDADVTNQVRITPATDMATKDSVGVIEGFAHRLLEDKLLTIPAVTTRTRYIIALQYDPVRAEQDGTPIVLDAFPGTLDQTQGKKYVLIYEGYRDPSTVLSQMTWTPVRSRLAPSITVQRKEHLPNPQHSGLIWGTRCYCSATGEEYMLGHHDDEGVVRMAWAQISLPSRAFISLPSNRRAMNAERDPRAEFKDGMVTLHGGFRTDSGGQFGVYENGHTLGTIPPGYRSPRQLDVITPVYSTSVAVVRIRIETNGVITAWPSSSTSSILIDSITFPAYG